LQPIRRDHGDEFGAGWGMASDFIRDNYKH
jgi:hypothetical protein